MKIDKVEAHKVDVPLDKSFGGGTYNVDRRTAIITKIYTDDGVISEVFAGDDSCLLYTSPSPRDRQKSRMPSSA